MGGGRRKRKRRGESREEDVWRFETEEGERKGSEGERKGETRERRLKIE